MTLWAPAANPIWWYFAVVFALVGCASTPARESRHAKAMVQVQVLEFSVDDPAAPVPHQVVPVGESAAIAGIIPRDSIGAYLRSVESMPGFTRTGGATLFDVVPLGAKASLAGDVPNKAGDSVPGHRFEVTTYGDDVVAGLPVFIEVKWWSPGERAGGSNAVSLPGAVLLRFDEAVVMRAPSGQRRSTAIAIITAQNLGQDGQVFQSQASRD